MLPFHTPQAQSQQQRRPQQPNDYVHRAPFFPPAHQQHPPFLTPAQQFEQMNHHNHHNHHHHQQQPPPQQQQQHPPPQQQQQQHPQPLQQQQQHPQPQLQQQQQQQQQQQHPQQPQSLQSPPPSRTPRPQQRPQQPIAPRPPQLDSIPPPQQSIGISRHPSLGQGQGLMRLLQFSNILASELKTVPQKLQLSWWNDLIKEYFTPKAFMKLTLWKDNQRKEAKPFEIGVPILPRFFLVTTQSGVRSMSLSLDGARERSIATGHCIVECVAAVWTYRYTNGYTVTLRGALSAHVIITSTSAPGSAAQPSNYAYKFDEFTFDANFHDKFIALDAINGQRTPEVTENPFIRGTSTPNANGITDPALSAEDDKKWEEPKIFIESCSIPGEPVNAFGIPQATMRCLELAESVSAMADLIVFSNEAHLGPLEALKSLAGKIREGNPPNLHPPDSTHPVTATATGIAAATGPVGINGYHQHPPPPPPQLHGPPFNPTPHTLYSGLPLPNQGAGGQPGQGGSGGSSIAPSPAATVNSPQTLPGSGMNSPQKVHKNIPPPIGGGGQPGQMTMQQHQQMGHPPSQVQTPVTPAMHSASLHGGNVGGMNSLGGMGSMGNMGNPGMNIGGGMGNMGGGGMGGMQGGTPIMGPSTTPGSGQEMIHASPSMATQPHPLSATPQQQVQGMVGVGMMVGGGEHQMPQQQQQQKKIQRKRGRTGTSGAG